MLRGCAIQLFIDQIQRGQPIAITDTDMTRFMLTLEDAYRSRIDCLCEWSHRPIFLN